MKVRIVVATLLSLWSSIVFADVEPVCVDAATRLQSSFEQLASQWAKPGTAKIRIDSFGRRLMPPGPMRAEDLEKQIAASDLVYTVEVSDFTLLRKAAQSLAELDWASTDQAPKSADIRYKVTLWSGGVMVAGFYVSRDENMLGNGCLFKARNRAWFKKFWRLVANNETYSPL